MNRRLLKIILLCVLPMLLIGCGSSRKSVRSGSSGRITSTTTSPSKGKGDGGASTGQGNVTLAEILREISDPMARDLVSEAGNWIGTQYVYGGSSRAGTDCSGLVMSVYHDVCGLKIPRTTRDQVKYCTQVARNKLRPGDLIFFGNGGSPENVSHVGMYVGNGRMIHASSSRGVIISGFESGYWADRYATGARVEAAPGAYASLGKSKKTVTPTTVTTLPPATPVAPTPPLSPAPEQSVSIDLLDLIISAKLDSIVASEPTVSL